MCPLTADSMAGGKVKRGEKGYPKRKKGNKKKKGRK